MQNRDAFLEAGGRRFSYVPALNDGPAHVAALGDLVLRHCGGWTVGGEDNNAELQISRDRALKMGAGN